MDDKKYIDESWKESVSSEKSEAKNTPDKPSQQDVNDTQKTNEQSVPEINFLSYITSLVYQAVIFLGEAPNPIDNKTEVNLTQAKLIIDTLQLLKEKTSGNLSKEEKDTLDTCLYELQMKYVTISQASNQK